MKRLMQIVLPVVLLLTACSKEKSVEFSDNDPNPGVGGGGGSTTAYFIKCKIGGVAKTFNVGTFATKTSAGGGNVMMVLGKANTSTTDLESFTFTISAGVPLAVGTYKVDDASTDYTMAGTYVVSQTISYWSLTGAQGGDPFRINITAIGNTEVAGTFQGAIFKLDATNPTAPSEEKAITEGEFKVKFQ